MSVQRMCQLASLPRACFYRWQPEKQGPDADLELRDTIQRIALEFPSYGRPRMTAELRRRGWVINPKKVQRILREDNLLCLRRRKFVLTTDSRHGLAVYPNLAREAVLSGLDQLWVADITYIRLRWEFVYLAVILDAYSRRVVGWALEDTLEGKLTIAALRMALQRRRPGAGLLHHSDCGVQYAANGYVDLLKQHEITISMSRKANPYDNAKAESFMKTLKYEEVYRWEYRDLAEARASIGCFLEKVYNEKRLHSALGYCPPAEFEQNLLAPPAVPAAVAEGVFRGMGKSFDAIGLAGGMRDAELLNSTPRPIVSMSFQLAIPWRVALPQSPPPLHQPGTIMQQRAAAGHQKPANGQQCLNYLSHPRGQAHYGSSWLVISLLFARNLGSPPAGGEALRGV